MIRPYAAVIIDSFREALASRVLWVLLGAIGCLLLSLAPFGYREVVTIEVLEGDVENWPRLIQRVRDDAAIAEPSPARHLVSRLDDKTRAMVSSFTMQPQEDFDGAMEFVRNVNSFRTELNKLVLQPEMYDEAAWKETPIASDELKRLLGQEATKLTATDIGRRNRLLLEAAFVDDIATSHATSFQIKYLTWDMLDPLPFRPAEFRTMLERVVAWIMGLLVGVVGVLVAIVVTSSIVPQMFDPGQLHLLLSKPVSRSLLFLSRFLGGCAFILLNATCLIAGLWLILGLRFDAWNHRLLLGIPIYLFMFAIYFTVSSLAGLLWRNAIVSIGATVLFWLFCFLLGSGKGTLENFYVSKHKLTQLVMAEETLVAVNEMGFAYAWDESAGNWSEILVTDVQKQTRPVLAVLPSIPSELRPVGPAYDATRKELVSIQRSMRDGQMLAYVGARSDGWKGSKGVRVSIGAMALLREPDGRLLAVGSTGIYRLVGDLRRPSEPVKMFGFSLPLPAKDAFQTVSPDPPLILARPASASVNPDTGELAIYSRGKLTVLEKQPEGRFQVRLEKSIDEENLPPALVAIAGERMVLGRDDGRIQLLDARTGEMLDEFQVEKTQAPRFLAAAPGGQWFAAAFHDGHVWTIDAAARTIRRAPVTGQGDVSAVLFRDATHLLVADRSTRVSEYELPNFQVARRWDPPATMLDRAYRRVVLPLYTVLPKPGELGNTVTYALSGKTAAPTDGRPRQSLETSQTSVDPWAPVWSSGAFMLVMLALGCFYLERQEF